MKKTFKLEEKVRAVKKASRPGVLASQVAEEIGIHTLSLYRWKKELRDLGFNNDMSNRAVVKKKLDTQDELRRLREENQQLKMENAVLKKLKEFDDALKKKTSK